jgi:serine/threonine-protein kinase
VPFDPDKLEVRGSATRVEEVASNPNMGFAQADFSSNGRFAYRAGGPEGLRTLQWVDDTGKATPLGLGLDPAYYQFPRLSPDGGRVVFTSYQESITDLFIYDWRRDSKDRLTTRIGAGYPVWSPDGRFVVFQSPGGMLWTRGDGAGRPQPLTRSQAIQIPGSFTRDGTTLVYSEVNPGGAEIRTVAISNQSGQLSAGESKLFLKTATGNAFAAVSPDGRWLAYADAEGGRYDVYVRAFPDNGTKEQVSNAGGFMPIWSRTGRELFYRTEDERIMVADYTVREGAFKPEKPRVWFVASTGLGTNLDLAPDGKRFVAVMPAERSTSKESQSHVSLVVNFFDEVRRRVAGQNK